MMRIYDVHGYRIVSGKLEEDEILAQARKKHYRWWTCSGSAHHLKLGPVSLAWTYWDICGVCWFDVCVLCRWTVGLRWKVQ